MNMRARLVQRVEKMWWKCGKPPWYLRILSPIYAKISGYDQNKRLKDAVSPSLPLISIGNVTVGGSGKTPFVVWLAQHLKQQGWQPVILCRGDGGQGQAPQVLDEQSLAADVGDEAVLLHRLTQCPVISARDRVEASQMAAQFGDVIVLDDGFQYRQLKRACDVVLVPDVGVGNGTLLPAGPLREPVENLRRADVVVRVGKQGVKALSEAKEWHWQVSGSCLTDWMACGQDAPQSVHAVTAIARPQRFVDSLNGLGLDVRQQTFFPDHHPFDAEYVANLLDSPLPIAVTAKDAVKLEVFWHKNRPLWVLEQASIGEDGLFDEIQSLLEV